jgi:hypothetical protein
MAIAPDVRPLDGVERLHTNHHTAHTIPLQSNTSPTFVARRSFVEKVRDEIGAG